MLKEEDRLSKEIIGAAIEVHRHLGPGLLESPTKSAFVRSWKLEILYLRDKNLLQWFIKE